MNDSDLKFDSKKDNTYHATTNLNTAIENPQINMNSAMGVNIQNTEEDIHSSFMNNTSDYDNNLVNNSNYNTSQNVIDNNINNYNVDQNQFNSSFTLNNSQVDNSQAFSTNTISDGMTNGPDMDNINNSYQSQFIPNTNNDVSYGNETFSDDNKINRHVSYEPTLKEKKKRGSGFEVSKEFKVMLFIVFILFLFILVIPYVYDFFKDLQLVITS